MPRITAATVVEHRAAQHRAILDAAAELITGSGGQVPPLSEVAAAVGLARSSIYQYVHNGTDLMVQLLLDLIPAWNAELIERLTAAGDDPAARLAVYIEGTFDLFAGGRHGALMTAARTVPEAFAHPRVRAEHDALMPQIRDLLDRPGSDGATALALLDAAVQRGAELVDAGHADREHTLAQLHRMAAGLLGCD
ncbi:TetR/AcrR family transcriptional regulator [Enemella sp. A6]|uniref:TetR/AcrR family transcriptional regulator n=1 Tax=Enemella sp. A6 TaxID=3440152 RepID=UPI003EB7D6F1